MGTTVLVIEDDLEINELLGEYLALENIKYVQATTGAAGIHLARTLHPDAIILDLMLPDVDGFEIARQLTGSRATYDIPVIILSCMCQDADKEKGFGNGATFYMTKPFLPDDLLGTVRQALAWRSTLNDRVAGGSAWLGGGGGKEGLICAKGLHQMVADLFTRTDMSDETVGRIRQAMELLTVWAQEWRKSHAKGGRIKVEYNIGERDSVEWRLTEEVPGLIEEAFFKPMRTTSGGGWVGRSVGAILNRSTPVPGSDGVPARWAEILKLTGARQFEKDTLARWVRFAHQAGLNAVAESAGAVPVVEMGTTVRPLDGSLTATSS